MKIGSRSLPSSKISMETQPPTEGSRWSSGSVFVKRIEWILGALCVVALILSVLFLLVPNSGLQSNQYLRVFIAMFLSIIVAIMPLILCLVQAIAKSRQLSKLNSLEGEPVSDTNYYNAAKLSIQSISPVTLGSDYAMPIISFFIILLLGSSMLFMASFATRMFEEPSFVLSGMKIVESNTTSLAAYQKGTFVVVAMAFVGAYVYTLSRLLDRLNNNDLYPISFHYYGARIIIACLTAAVYRHAADSLIENIQPLVLLGFVTGIAPDLFISAMARRAFQTIRVFGSKSDPDPEFRPTTLPLLALDDLTREKIDRLAELGIDSAQALACQNPISIWPRLPYDLGLIVDWIAQAQLYALVRERGLSEVRKKYVTDIFDFYIRLSGGESCGEVCVALGLDPKSAPALVEQIGKDQSFSRLKEVRDALNPTSTATASHD